MTRGPYDGVLNIVRFNWPFFVGTSIVSITCGALALSVSSPVWRLLFSTVAAALVIAVLGVFYFGIFSESVIQKFSHLPAASVIKAEK